MMTFLPTEDGSLLNVAHIYKISQSGDGLHAHHLNGSPIKLDLHVDIATVEEMTSAVVPAQPGTEFLRVWFSEGGTESITRHTVVAWRLVAGAAVPVAYDNAVTMLRGEPGVVCGVRFQDGHVEMAGDGPFENEQAWIEWARPLNAKLKAANEQKGGAR